jgi:hypothetical protein
MEPADMADGLVFTIPPDSAKQVTDRTITYIFMAPR